MTIDERRKVIDHANKEIIKEAFKEWLEEKFSEFGKWTMKSLAAMCFGALLVFLVTHGWIGK